MIVLPSSAGLFRPGTASVDPYWANVVSLLNFPGADGSTTFTDAKGKIWTAAGTAQIDNSLGYNAGQFTSPPAWIASASNADWAMGAGDFTIEAWIYLPPMAGDRNIFNVNIANAISFGLTGGKIFLGSNSVSYGVIGATTITASTLTHVAASKSSGTTRIFVGGTVDATGADAYNYVQSSASVAAGSNNSGVNFTGYLGGWIRAFRLTKGVARYTANFTPPSAPFPTS